MGTEDKPDKPKDPPTLPSQRSAELAVEETSQWGELGELKERQDRLERLLEDYSRDTRNAVVGRVISTPPPPPPIASIHAIEQTVKKQPSRLFDVVTKGVALVLYILIEWLIHR